MKTGDYVMRIRTLMKLNIVAAFLVLWGMWGVQQMIWTSAASAFRELESNQVINHSALARSFPHWESSPRSGFADMVSSYLQAGVLGVPCILVFLMNAIFLWRMGARPKT